MMQKIHLLDVQGHRGCRGILPENTIPAFEKAVNIGVTTLELDVVVSGDSQIIISHEPFFNHEITIGPKGQVITQETELDHSVFQLSYDQIKQYDVGSKVHSKFVNQQKMVCYKPSLSDMVTHIEKLNSDINYNIELKRKPEWEGFFLPELDTFVDIFIKTVNDLGIANRLSIQSFDLECLQNLKQKTDIPLVLLSENSMTVKQNIDSLGFKPDIYSPDHKLVDLKMIKFCRANDIKLIPWTANSDEELNKLMDLKVDGIITDYPDRLIELINKRSDIERL